MKVSIILCAQNSEKYIEKTINSILIQSYQNFELIIILNCSYDATEQIINTYKDPRIFLYKTDIGQLSFNLNYGINLAKGDYIVRIDADDIAKGDRIAKQLGIIEKYNFDVVGSNINFINEKGEYLKYHRLPEDNIQIRKNILFKSVIAHPTVMIRKSTLLSVSGYLGGRYAQDYDLWLRLMRNKNILFYNIQEPLVDYRIHQSQSKGNKNSYAEVAGYFLKEMLYTNNIKYLIGTIIYTIKSIFLGK